MKCWWCNGLLNWQSDHHREDCDGVEGMITYLTCSECDAFIVYNTGEEYI